MQLFETMKLEDGCIYREVYHLKNYRIEQRVKI